VDVVHRQNKLGPAEDGSYQYMAAVAGTQAYRTLEDRDQLDIWIDGRRILKWILKIKVVD
jgi:hypothetical protein